MASPWLTDEARSARHAAVAREAAAKFAAGAPLLECLHHVQDSLGFLPRLALEEFAFESRLAREQVWSAASFYSNFRAEPPPVVEARVCTSVACHLRGGTELQARLSVLAAKQPQDLGVKAAACLGACDQAPALLANGGLVSRADRLSGAELVAVREVPVPAYERLGAYRAGGGMRLFESLARERAFEPTIAALIGTGLRGMGGAGFSAGKKWEFVAKAQGSPKYVVVNADEGEPGTFKDRWILERTPHRMLEGMLAAMLCVGADQAWIYVREEYAAARRALAACLDELREARLLDAPLQNGRTLSARLVVGAGAYICGEETALLESIEGKRGEPRLKPPFPAQFGLFGKPTLINNVETLWWVPEALGDPETWKRSGTTAPGRKLYSVSGDVARPGVYELPLGTSLREIVAAAGGMEGDRALKAFFPGGISAGLLPASQQDVPMDFDALAKAGSMLGSGGVVVLDERRCVVDVAENCLSFFAHESCGKCTPCRVGTEKMLHAVREIRAGKASPPTYSLMEALSRTMAGASICGLGQTAFLPFTSGLRYFRQEYDEHLGGRCPTGACRP
ncbi:MAG TPA: NADH-ubiquinone oxidoreductase-F iron-sulfur binding region domain-containing protein [Candidatus Thermoplasmatota archaeon]|nr:NADH-ubiquinone oxidoreductase-F iron-sulfur binding region domain-containing protein [Candidatus Thermoplasmatota archaeon]